MKLYLASVAFVSRHLTFIIVLLAVLFSIASLVYYYLSGQILAYGDAESHINIAKRVIDGLTPGFSQLGGVWLPLHHLLMLPFVANDFMWRSGLGGAIVSALGYVMSSFFVYKLGSLLSGRRWVGALAFFIYALNPNILYMQATPMSELPLLAFITASAYFFIKWLSTPNTFYLVLAAAFIFAGSLVRYDAWFMAGVEAIALCVFAAFEKWSNKKREAMIILFVTLAFFGCVLWLLWNQIIFNDPLYFINGPYSAKSQQLSFVTSGQLPTYHNVFESIRYYFGAAISNSGLPLFIIGLMGAISFFFGRKMALSKKVLIIMVVSSVAIFNVLALFLGISIMFIPHITPADSKYQLFNVRYGMMVIPFLALFVGVLISKIKQISFRYGAAAIVLLLTVSFTFTQPITLTDGISGLSARFQNESTSAVINNNFHSIYDYGYVAFDDFARPATPVSLGIPMNKIIYVGSHPYWENMLKNPNQYARWLVIRKNDTIDKAIGGSSVLKDNYKPVIVDHDITLYRCSVDCAAPNFSIVK